MASAKRPSRLYYLLPAATIFLGAAIAVWVLLSGLLGFSHGMVRVAVPGTATLQLTPGNYTIFHEYQTLYDNALYSEQPQASIAGLRVSLYNPATGQPVSLSVPSWSSSYSFGSQSGTSVLSFHVDEPGAYQLQADYPDHHGLNAVLAIGKSMGASLLWSILYALLILIVTAAGGIVWILLIYRRRQKTLESSPE